MSDHKLRAAKESDLDAIVRLEECFTARERWSREAWRSELASDATNVFVVEAPSPVAVASFGNAIDIIELRTIAVSPNHRRNGLAAQLVREGLKWACGTSAEQMFLEVAQDNVPAATLYKKLGFELVSRRKSYYGPGRDALVMARAIR
ncbi:GNAT family N-acetyltransferase [Propionimicrobium lymphophilum]|uniref:GNAT family N-acetyltransferase n=1 Tax=Propionimicrobium lymphophilum TaxID=33012 RepID=UPI0023F35AC6|nr:GNAT family N-acetyltransferase [Propionimicrobium lymphophilum]